MKSAFAGCLDLCHGPSIPQREQDRLRLLAVLYPVLVVPDGFFHCYGPIYYKAKEFVDRRIPFTSSEVKDDLILGLIASGAILPAMRSGESTLVGNYKSGMVKQGQYLIPQCDEAIEVLTFLDRLLRGRVAPNRWEAKDSKRTFYALESIYLKPDSSALVADLAGRLNLEQQHDFEWRPVLDEFISAIAGQRGNDFFMRGPLEHCLARGMSTGGHFVYSMLARRSDTPATSRGRLVRHLFHELTSYYQAGQGSVLADVASVTSLVDGHRVQSHALAHALNRTPDANREIRYMEVPGQLNGTVLRQLKVQDLVELRNGPLLEFREALQAAIRTLNADADEAAIRQAMLDASHGYRIEIAKRSNLPIANLARALTDSSSSLLPPELSPEIKFAIVTLLKTVGVTVAEMGSTPDRLKAAHKLGPDFGNFLSAEVHEAKQRDRPSP